MSAGGFSNPLVGGGGSLVYPAIHSPNYVPGVSGWSIKKDGSAEFDNLTFRGTFNGTNFIINSSGAFFYSGTPALGNLILSISENGGTDSFGNIVKPGFASYQGSPIIVAQLFGGEVTFLQEGTTNTPALVGLGGVSPTSQGLLLSSGNVIPGVKAGTLGLLDANSGLVPGLPIAQVNGTFEVSAASAAGQLLVVQNTTAAPSEPAEQIIVAAAGDNSLGIMVAGDTFNRVKFTTTGLQIGSGSAGQDARLTRNPAGGSWFADTIYANNSGAPETWHTLGTLAGATVNLGEFRLLSNGMVLMVIDITFAVATAVPINFSVTLPAAYQPLGSVDVRRPMAQTNAAGGIGRIFVGSVGGSNPGLVQFTTLGAGNAIGTYSAEVQYPLI